jgi:glycosyltransferase involved in cell wall biosynthesis
VQGTRILFILPEYYPHSGGGISTYYLQYIAALNSHVEKIKVLVGSGYIQADEKYLVDGIEIEYLKPSIYKEYFKNFEKFELFPEYRKNLAAAWAMFDQAKQGENFDIIECVDFGLGFVPWLVKHNKPVVTRLHGSAGQIELHENQLINTLLGDFNRQAEYLLLQQSDKIITHSRANQDFWQKIFLGKQIDFIEPIFLNETTPISFNEKEDIGIVCGRIQNWKGPDVLCEAIKNHINDNILINWYGRDMSADGKNSKSDQLSSDYKGVWKQKIIPHHPIEHKRLLEVQKKAKYAIIPSTWDMYNFTCLEYMSVGTIVICSDGAGVSELIEDGINGFKYPSQDPKLLADCIKKVRALNENDHNRIVENAFETLNTVLATSKIIDANLAYYTKMKSSFLVQPSTIFADAMFQPSNLSYNIGQILDQQPVKLLFKYLFTRLKKKIND